MYVETAAGSVIVSAFGSAGVSDISTLVPVNTVYVAIRGDYLQHIVIHAVLSPQ
jgi:hypothetical protein